MSITVNCARRIDDYCAEVDVDVPALEGARGGVLTIRVQLNPESGGAAINDALCILDDACPGTAS